MKTFLFIVCELALAVAAIVFFVWASSTGYYFSSCPHSDFTLFSDRAGTAVSWGLLTGLFLWIYEPPSLLLGGLACIGIACLLHLCRARRRFALACLALLALGVCLLPIGYAVASATQAYSKCSIGW